MNHRASHFFLARATLSACLVALWNWRPAATEQAIAPLSAEKKSPNVYLFDMGTEDSPLWAGFTRVTPATAYTAAQGYGWLNPPSDLKAQVSECIDALAVDSISGIKNNTITFRLDVPDGDYAVWVLTGTMGSVYTLGYLLRPHDLLLQGKNVLHIEPKDTDMYRCAHYDWSKGDDVYDQFIAPRFTWLRQEVAVTNKQLEIGFGNAKDFPVCALVVASRDVANRMEEKMRQLEMQRKAAFHEFYREVEPPRENPGNVTAEEQRRGYAVAAVNCEEDVNPWSQPPAGASRSKIEVFSIPGEQEQASFVLYGLRDLREAQFEVTDLISKESSMDYRPPRGGERNISNSAIRDPKSAIPKRVLPASSVERGLVQFIPWKAGPQQYQLVQGLILPARSTFVGEGTCKRFWLTLHIPENAAAGIYEGKICIACVNAPPSTLDLRVRVLPLKPMVPPVERFLYFGTMFYLARALMPEFDETKFWNSMRAEVKFLKANEFTRAELLVDTWTNWYTMKDGKVVDFDLSPTAKLMQILHEENAMPRDNTMVCHVASEIVNILCGGYWREGGQGRPQEIKFAPTPEGRAKFIEAIRLLNDKVKKAGWPEVAYEAGGEYTNYGVAMGGQFGVDVHSAFKEAGVKSALRGNGAADMVPIFKGLVDYPQPNWAMMRTEWLNFMKSHSKRLWAYNFAEGRFAFGWWCFKHGITRMSHEGGIYMNGQPDNLFDTDTDTPTALPTSLTTFAPTVRMKRYVEGALDYKYLYTLDRLIRNAQVSKRPAAMKAAQAAQDYLNRKLNSIPNGLDRVREDIRDYNDVAKGMVWSNQDLDKFRWQVAEHIMTIQKTMGR